MAYKDFKSMFVKYQVPDIVMPAEKQQENIPLFRNKFVWDFIDSKITEKQSKEQKPQEEIRAVYDNQVEENPWAIEGSTKITKARRVTNKTGYKQFQTQLDEYMENNPQDISYRDMLTNLAAMESSFDQYAKNPWSTALGYFQFVDKTRLHYNTMSREQFANDPQEQIRVAVAHLKDLKKDIQRNVSSDIITNSGLTPLQLIYGMWWRPQSMYNYLKTGTDNFQTKDGMNIKRILEKAS